MSRSVRSRRLATVAATVAVLTGCGMFSATSVPTAAPLSAPLSAPPDAVPTSRATPTSPATPTPTSPAAPAGAAVAALARLPVAGWASAAGYSRDAFGQRWSDDVGASGGHNGCDQRSDILRRDLDDVVIKRNTQGCVPAAGTLRDPYTGATIRFVRGSDTSAAVQIDHVVALSNAWRTGAQQLTARQRQDFAGDPLGLLAVDGATNQAKGDDDAAGWLPPRAAFHCDFVARQIAVKTKYRLWVTPAEAASMSATLASCPDQPLPDDTDVPAPVR